MSPHFPQKREAAELRGWKISSDLSQSCNHYFFLDVPELDNDEESVSAPIEGAPSEDADEDEGNLVIDDTKVGGGMITSFDGSFLWTHW